jgi:hypothetical protein
MLWVATMSARSRCLRLCVTVPLGAFAVLAACTGSQDGGSGASSAGTGPAGTAGAGAAGGGDAPGGTAGAGLGDLIGPTPGTKIGFVGDTGLGINSQQVLALIKNEGAHLALHLGDFDYEDDAAGWEQMMNDALGELPWLAVVGNHDVDAWSAYEAVLQRKLAALPADVVCEGQPGVQHSCTFRGVHIVLSGVGLLGSGHGEFLASTLGASRHVWRMCGWHLNQADMNVGEKGDEAGWEPFQACQAEGAMIVNGHEHSYARTLTLGDVGNAAAGHGAGGDWDLVALALGHTYVTVSGMGGKSLRAYAADRHDDDTWWSSGFTSNVTIDDGTRTPSFNLLESAAAVFVELGVDGDPRKARGTMKTISGKLVDEWTVTMDPAGIPTQG